MPQSLSLVFISLQRSDKSIEEFLPVTRFREGEHGRVIVNSLAFDAADSDNKDVT